MAEVYVHGLAELDRKLRELPRRIGMNATKRALRKGANVIRDGARVNAKRLDDTQTKDNIAKNITTQGGSAKRNRQEKGVVMRVGVLGGAKKGGNGSGNPGGDTWYWRLLEFGTSKMQARPFMRTAMNSEASKAFSVIAESMSAEFDKEIAKL